MASSWLLFSRALAQEIGLAACKTLAARFFICAGELPLTDEHAWHVSPLPFPGTAEAPLRTKSATRLLRARAGHVYLGVGSISDSLTSARVINYLTLLGGRAAPHAIAANVS